MIREQIRKDLELIKREIDEYLAGGPSPNLSTVAYQEVSFSLSQYLDKEAYNAIREAYRNIEELDKFRSITAVSSQDFVYVRRLVEKALSFLL